MNDQTNTSNTSVESLVNSVLKGTVDESTLGTFLKTLQVSMGANLLRNQETLVSAVESLNSQIEKLLSRYTQLMEFEVDNLTSEGAWEKIESIMGLQIKVVDLQRKIVQGKPLFNSDVLSDEERMVVKLLNSFSSIDEKKKFLKVVKDTLEKNKDVEEFE